MPFLYLAKSYRAPTGVSGPVLTAETKYSVERVRQVLSAPKELTYCWDAEGVGLNCLISDGGVHRMDPPPSQTRVVKVSFTGEEKYTLRFEE